MDTNFAIQLISAAANLAFVILTLVSVIFVYKTIKSNQEINQKIIFNEVVKQERELRIKLFEYKEKIINPKTSPELRNKTKLDYDTLLFNYVRKIKLQLSGCRSYKATSDFSEHPKVAQTADFSLQNTQRLFDYEYLAICVYQRIICEKEVRRYFNNLLKAVYELFDKSILFIEGYAEKNQYPGLQWLFEHWKVIDKLELGVEK